MAADLLAAWLFTYAMHSTLLLALALGITRTLGSDRMREALWKAALLASLFSTTLQVGFGVQPFHLAWQVPSVASLTTPAPPHAEPGQAAVAADRGPQPPPAARTTPGGWPSPLWLWLAGSGAVLGVYFARRWRLGRQLDDQQEIVQGPLLESLRRLCRRQRLRRHVRLMTSANVSAPVAYGILEPRIVLPRRALVDLDAAQLDSMLAHELAHLVRGDPAWLLVCRLLEGLFFFQPLNHVARRQLQELAEYRCDAWAVNALGANVPLASCLVEVASWLRGPAHDALVPAMASSESSLSRRVHRLLEDPAPAARASRWREAALSTGVLLLACAVPGFSAFDHGRAAAGGRTPLPTYASDAEAAAAACDALDGELRDLDAELLDLRAAISAARDPSPYLDSLNSIVSRVRQLEQHRARLVSWIQSAPSR
ncbi:MAG: M56 family metallopeptidase [Planctomycetota bacterium]